MTRIVVATDNFNRADGTLGANWTDTNSANAGTLLIATNQLVGQFSQQPTGHQAASRWSGAGSFTTDQYAKLTLVNVAGNNGINVCHGVQTSCAGADATRSCYEFYVAQDSATTPTTFLVRWSSGTRTVLFSGTQAWANNDTISLEFERGILYGCRNDVRLGGSWVVSDATLSGGTPGAVSDSVALGDNWEGGNMDTIPSLLTVNLASHSKPLLRLRALGIQ
jgi:hypothetical protein